MKNEQFSPEQLKQTADRVQNEAHLVRGGAEYVNSDSGPRLEVTENQIDRASDDMKFSVLRDTPPEQWTSEAKKLLQDEIDKVTAEYLDTVKWEEGEYSQHKDRRYKLHLESLRFSRKGNFDQQLKRRMDYILGDNGILIHNNDTVRKLYREARDKCFELIEDAGYTLVPLNDADRQ